VTANPPSLNSFAKKTTSTEKAKSGGPDDAKPPTQNGKRGYRSGRTVSHCAISGIIDLPFRKKRQVFAFKTKLFEDL